MSSSVFSWRVSCFSVCFVRDVGLPQDHLCTKTKKSNVQPPVSGGVCVWQRQVVHINVFLCFFCLSRNLDVFFFVTSVDCAFLHLCAGCFCCFAGLRFFFSVFSHRWLCETCRLPHGKSPHASSCVFFGRFVFSSL